MSRRPTRLASCCGLAAVAMAAAALLAGCRGARQTETGEPRPADARPSILLVTLDTTRADAIGPEARGVDTPAFNALAARGRRFRQAYATAPETLPSHASMLTGLYPAGHGLHENGRSLQAQHAPVAERLRAAGYRTGAIVSSVILARRFGLARGFDTYDDAMPGGRVERTAIETTEAALAAVASPSSGPVFLWVHYFDPHHPYTPPEPFRRQYAARPYFGEVAAMDAQLGRLVAAFESRARAPVAIVVAGDHGEGLGDHGEYLHGNLLYQSTMHVPLVLVGPGVQPGTADTPVSLRRVFHTLLDLAGAEGPGSLRGTIAEPVLGEAMRPFLNYGWQPQVMAVEGRSKWILAGRVETYDVAADPAEQRDLAREATAPPAPPALRDYPVPSAAAVRAPAARDEQTRRELASLGYVSAGAAPIVRRDAPRPIDMVGLFETLDRASGLFVNEEYRAAIPLLERILARDPSNLDAILRLATAWSALEQAARAEAAFRKAIALAPQSDDVRLYVALHEARGANWARAVATLERAVAETPDRLAAVEALARVREKQGRPGDAIALWRAAFEMKPPAPAELVRLGRLAMEVGDTPGSVDLFERARAQQGDGFQHDLELGVLYLAARRLEDARAALDRVSASHPAYPMALFKRAQVSVLLNEPDHGARIDLARRRADATTRDLIARERLFKE